MKIIFLGSADFGLPALQALIKGGHEIVGIVSTPAKPKGRGLKLADSPVVEYARVNGISPIITPASLKDPLLPGQLAALGADLFVVIAFRILPPEIFGIAPHGTVNVHASLLPLYRGSAPIHRAIENGEKTTGVTVFRIDAGIDTGGVLVQKSLDIGPIETTPQLYERLSLLGADALMESVEKLQRGGVEPLPQTHQAATKAPKLTRDEGLIDWTLTAESIFNKVRAFKPFPGTYTFLDAKRLAITGARVSVQDSSRQEPGTITNIDREGFTVQCKDSHLKVTEVKPDGKGIMAADAFMRGNPLGANRRLG